MVKKICLVVILINLTIILHAQSPLGNRGREWDEQDGYAIIEGTNYHYWLYNIWYYLESGYGKGKSYSGCLDDLISDLHRWVERQDWIIDYENYYSFNSSDSLSLSVKRLMDSRGRATGGFRQSCEVAVLLNIENEKKAELRIHNWNSMKENMYTSYVWPLLKF